MDYILTRLLSFSCIVNIFRLFLRRASSQIVCIAKVRKYFLFK